MKFTLSALLLGVVMGHEMFLQDGETLAATADHTDTIGSGSCQGFFGDDIIDLKPFDQHNRDMKHHMAAIEPAAGANNYFVYKLCQNEFTMNKDIDLKNSTTMQNWDGTADTTVSNCPNKGNAYIANHDG